MTSWWFFFSGIKKINEEKCQRKIQEKTEAKKPEKWPRNGDQTAIEKWAKTPWSPATSAHGRRRPQGSGSPDFPRKPTFSDPSRISRRLAPVILSNSDFWSMISVDLRQHHGSDVEIIRSSLDTPKQPTGRPRKYTFCPTNQKSTGQMLSAHWHQLMSKIASPSNIKQYADPLMIIARRIPKGTARPVTLQAT